MKTTGSKRIAQRYVKALFETAGAKLRDAVESDLAALARALEESAELRNFLRNPLLERDQQAAAMDALLDKMRAQEITRQFIAMLAKQKRLDILPDIIALYGKWAQEARGELTAEMISAVPLGEKEVALIALQLGKAYGKKIHLSVSQDPSLLGGMVVKIGSQQLDSSLSGKLDRLKLKLKAA